MDKTSFKFYLEKQEYDKWYQDIDCLGFVGYSESYKTWDNIKNLINWGGQQVIEVGTFHGYFAFKAKESGAKQVIGLEKVPEILLAANVIKKMNGLNVEFRQWDSTQLVPDSGVSLVLNCLHHFPNQEEFLSRINSRKIIFEVNLDQVETIKKYFTVIQEVPSHRSNRIILLCKKELELLALDFTNVCNYRCIFCEAAKYSPNVLRLNEFAGIESLIQTAFYVDITGYGESTAHPDFPEIVKLLTKYNKRFSIVSNGSFLEKHMELLANSSIYLLNISVNTLNPDTYKIITGGRGDLNKVLNNIQNYYNYCNQQVNLREDKVIRQFSFVINSHNFKEMKNFIDYGVQFITDKVRVRVVFRGLSPTLVYPEGLAVENNEENRKFLEEVNKYARGKVEFETFNFAMNREHRNNIEEKSSLFDEDLRKIVKGCNTLTNSLYIGSDGTVAACCWVRTPLGNIKKQTIEEIRNGEVYQDLAKCLKEGNLKYCMNCRRGS